MNCYRSGKLDKLLLWAEELPVLPETVPLIKVALNLTTGAEFGVYKLFNLVSVIVCKQGININFNSTSF